MSRSSYIWLVLLSTFAFIVPVHSAGLRDSKNDGYAGRVRTVRCEEEVTDDDAAASQGNACRLTEEIEYDWNGRKTRLVGYFPDNSRSVWTTGENGKAHDQTTYSPNGIPGLGIVYHYDAHERLAEKDTFSGNILAGRDVYSYSDGGKKRVDQSFTNRGKDLDHTEVDLFDDHGNQTEHSVYNLSGALVLKQTFDFDANGLPCGDSFIRGDGSILEKCTYVRDSNGCPVQGQDYGVGGQLEAIWFSTCRDYNKPLSYIKLNADGTLARTESTSYDNSGNEISFQRYGPDGSLLEYRTHSYQYDSEGNWITDVETVTLRNADGSQAKHLKTAYQTITYY